MFRQGVRLVTIQRRLFFTDYFQYMSSELFHPSQLHVKACSNLLVQSHNIFPIPWDFSIAFTAVLIRTLVTVPFYIYSEQNYAKVLYVSIDCQKSRHLIVKKLEELPQYSIWSDKVREANVFRLVSTKITLKLNQYKHFFYKTCEANGCHPLKSAATALVQFPLWLTFSFSLRNVCGFHLASGYGWPVMIPEFVSHSLSIPCSTMILPIGLLISGLMNVELAYLRRPRSISQVSNPVSLRIARFFGWFSNFGLFAITTVVPKALVIYWFTSAFHQFCTHLLFMHPGIRHLFGLYLLPHEGNEPFKVLMNSIKSRYFILRWLIKRKFGDK